MKSVAIFLIVAVFCTGSLFARTTIKVGASEVPHAQILRHIKPMLEKQGYDLDIRVFSDYILPNLALEKGDLDANFFQHVPYMEEFNRLKHTHIVKVVAVHIEPMGIYSKRIRHVSELKAGDKVSLSNDPTNESRALRILEKAGLITLPANKTLCTPQDITSNPKQLRFVEMDPAQIPRSLRDVTLSCINTNYALAAGLTPLRDALLLEDKNSPYANVLSAKEGTQNDPKIQALARALNAESVRAFILSTYKGAVLPAF